MTMDNGHAPGGSLCLSATVFNSVSNIKERIVIVPSINLSALVNTTHVTINEKDWVLVVYFHHCYTMHI